MGIRFYQLKNGQKFKVVDDTDYAQDLVGKVLERAGDAGNTCLDEEQNVHNIPGMTFVSLVKESKAPKKKPSNKSVKVTEPDPSGVINEILQEQDANPIEELLGGESA